MNMMSHAVLLQVTGIAGLVTCIGLKCIAHLQKKTDITLVIIYRFYVERSQDIARPFPYYAVRMNNAS